MQMIPRSEWQTANNPKKLVIFQSSDIAKRMITLLWESSKSHLCVYSILKHVWFWGKKSIEQVHGPHHKVSIIIASSVLNKERRDHQQTHTKGENIQRDAEHVM